MIRWLLLALLVATPVRAAEITVLVPGAFKQVAAALIPPFEARTGNHVIMKNDTAGGLVRRVEAGEPFDVVLLSASGMDGLTKTGKVAAGSAVAIAKVGVGVGVKAGAPKPDIGTVAAFKSAMLAARSVAYIDPAAGGSSGIYVAKLFRKLGIADAIASKSVLVKGGLAAEAVVDGRATLVIQQISELLTVPGVTLVGPLPPEIQNETVYSGAIGSASTAPDAARALLETFAGPAARPVLAKMGMMPP